MLYSKKQKVSKCSISVKSVLLISLCLCCYISRESKTTRNVLWSRASVCLCVCVCVSVCLYAAACLQYCTDPDVTWGSGRGCSLVVHYWADLQSVHGMRCYGNIMEMHGRAQR